MRKFLFKKLSIVLVFAMIFAASLVFTNVVGVNADVASHLVISEIYGGGGNTGATWKNDFVEIYNPTDYSVSLTGWSIQYASATGVFGSYKTYLSGSVSAHGYYLVQEAAGAGGTQSLPTPDAIGTITMSATAGKVALSKATTTVTGPTDSNVVDFVGYGSTANQYEGTGPAPAPSNTKSIERKDNNGGTVEGEGNGWDTNNNSSDLVATSTIVPQNSSSPIEPAISPTPTPTGQLEIYHIDVGQADCELVKSPSGESLLIDCGEEDWSSDDNAQIIGTFIQSILGTKHLDYVLSTHFHVDHLGYVGYGGLWNLVEVQGFDVDETIIRDYNNYLGLTSGTFDNWKTYLESTEGISKLNPVVVVDGTSQIDLGDGVTVDIIAHDGNGALKIGDFSDDTDPPSENDYSIGVKITYGAFDEWIGGDLDGQYYDSGYGYKYHDIELSAAREIGDVDVYKVNHHGSDHSSNVTFVGELDPEVSIISVGDENPYGHPRQSVMDLLLATSQVYMTERGDTSTDIGDAIVAGTIAVKTDGVTYTVNNDSYTAINPVCIDADGDGYFSDVDPDDTSIDIIPLPNGGYDTEYQP